MKKLLFIVNIIIAIVFTTRLNAQNVFPATGNVGIGTAAPTQKLEVIGGSILTDGAVYSNAWFRSYGASGWYNETYGGGIHMLDNLWVRTYGAKNFYCDQVIRADGGFQVAGLPVIDAGAGWHRTYGDSGWYNGTYEGGLYMIDNTWIRTYNNKAFYSSNTIRTDGELQVGDSGNRRIVKPNGNVGIGILDPVHKLDVIGNAYIRGNMFANYVFAFPQNTIGEGGEIYLAPSNTSLKGYNIDTFYNSFRIFAGNNVRFTIADNGNTGIGTSNPDEKLTVKGKIHAEEIRVDLQVPADYVFEKYYTGTSSLKADYKMPSLSEIEEYTRNHNHLPNVPSAQEINEKGLQVGEITNTLLQKIEEMTLYMIEMKKEIQQLQKENLDLKLNQAQK